MNFRIAEHYEGSFFRRAYFLSANDLSNPTRTALKAEIDVEPGPNPEPRHFTGLRETEVPLDILEGHQ
jgi:hypothetical protein